MAERIAVRRIVRHEEGKPRIHIMPGQFFNLSEEEARRLDARGDTRKPNARPAREPAVDISSVAEREEVVEAGVASPEKKPAGKNGTTTREKPPADDEPL